MHPLPFFLRKIMIGAPEGEFFPLLRALFFLSLVLWRSHLSLEFSVPSFFPSTENPGDSFHLWGWRFSTCQGFLRSSSGYLVLASSWSSSIGTNLFWQVGSPLALWFCPSWSQQAKNHFAPFPRDSGKAHLPSGPRNGQWSGQAYFLSLCQAFSLPPSSELQE